MTDKPSPSQPIKSAKGALSWVGRFLGPLLLLLLIVTKVDLTLVIEVIRQIRPELYVAALSLSALPILLRAWRWHMLLKIYDIVYPWFQSLNFFLVGFAAGFFLPTGLGEILRIGYPIEDGYSVRRSFLTILWDKIFDWVSVLIFGIPALFVLPLLPIDASMAYIIISLALLFVGLILFRKPIKQCLVYLIRAFLSKQLRRLAHTSTTEVIQDLRAIPATYVILLEGCTVLLIFISYVAVYLLVLGLSLNLSLVQVIAILAVARFASKFMPLAASVADLGVRDILQYTLFLMLGEPGEAAIALTALMFSISLFWHIIALIGWINRPIHFGASGKQFWQSINQKWQDVRLD